MERCKTLINRLLEQADANADPSVMMITAQLLHAELSKLITDRPKENGTPVVSVTFPSFHKMAPLKAGETDNVVATGQREKDMDRIPEQEKDHSPQSKQPETPAGGIKPANRIKEDEDEKTEQNRKAALEKEERLLRQFKEAEVVKQSSDHTHIAHEMWLIDPVLETPTLAHQDEVSEINEKMGKSNGESLNDRLKTARTDISSFLTDAPVRDLKKAIGINDRFLFVNELFRGDVDMYERSIKTINNFRILAEAEYWIDREMKIKLGWDDASDTVKHFSHLVKRRFS